MREKEQPKCPQCGSKVLVYRKRDDNYICRRCGTISSREEVWEKDSNGQPTYTEKK